MSIMRNKLIKLFFASCKIITIALFVCCSSNEDIPVVKEKSLNGDRLVHVNIKVKSKADLYEGATTNSVKDKSRSVSTRAAVNTATGGVDFVNGDRVLAANNGRYIGKLIYYDGLLSGDVLQPDTCDYIHLYFLGNKQPDDLVPGQSTSCMVDLSDQTKQIPLLCYGKSIFKYSEDESYIFCIMECKCAILEIDLVEDTNEHGTLSKMHVCAQIDFVNPNNAITTVDSTSTVTLYADGKNKRYAVVMPQEPVDSAIVAICNEHIMVTVPKVEVNHAYVGNRAIRVHNENAFSVAPGRKVKFARGNLQQSYVQAIGNNIYRIAGNQYDLIHREIDNRAMPPSDWQDLLSYQDRFGFDGTIDNESGWRLLTEDELNYLLGGSEQRAGKHFWGNLLDIPGLFLLPDHYAGDIPWENTIQNTRWGIESWEKEYQASGVIFLPALHYTYYQYEYNSFIRSLQCCYWLEGGHVVSIFTDYHNYGEFGAGCPDRAQFRYVHDIE